jgi:alkanesulfonate monooxygenase SsuD/methylene tetrahydromethanopterin reductase-like flavin-dependent oxidoreductase (luciferase family)
VRWFPAMVSNHVKDLIARYGADGAVVPRALTDYVPDETGYDYDEHSRVGAKHGAFVSDEICDRFCVLGTPDQAAEKLRELESIGVDQFNIYLMTEGQEATLEAYGRDVIPRFAGVSGGAA